MFLEGYFPNLKYPTRNLTNFRKESYFWWEFDLNSKKFQSKRRCLCRSKTYPYCRSKVNIKVNIFLEGYFRNLKYPTRNLTNFRKESYFWWEFKQQKVPTLQKQGKYQSQCNVFFEVFVIWKKNFFTAHLDNYSNKILFI